MLADKHRLICTLEALQSRAYLTRRITLKGRPASAIVFMFAGDAYSYVNLCMHMQRPLNCERDTIFDETGRFLRCSMHGFIFDPETGACLSPVCAGQRLQSLRLEAIDGVLYFAEKHLTLSESTEQP